jgi:hypothetical protein
MRDLDHMEIPAQGFSVAHFPFTLLAVIVSLLFLPPALKAEEAAHQVLFGVSSTTISGYVSSIAIWHPGIDTTSVPHRGFFITLFPPDPITATPHDPLVLSIPTGNGQAWASSQPMFSLYQNLIAFGPNPQADFVAIPMHRIDREPRLRSLRFTDAQSLAVVPEPSSISLIIGSSLGLLFAMRRRPSVE